MLSNLFAVKHNYLPQYSSEDIINEINRMEDENLLIANNKSITLTDDGETYVYGPFSIETGIQEFMTIFEHFHVGRNQGLLPSNILAVKDKILSPQSNKYFKEIITESQRRRLISEGTNNIILTESGFQYLYG